MSWWSAIFGAGAKGVSVITDSIGKILDESITNKEELANAQVKLNKTISDNSKSFVDARSKTLVTEMSGSWLQRSWRPIVMLEFAQVVLYQYVIAPIFELKTVEVLDDRFWEMLALGLGGYVALRSGEKITSQIINYKNKKRRNDSK